MAALFEQVTIVGLGLMGGSLGIAMRRHGVAKQVVGVSRKASTLAAARRLGAIDAGAHDARHAAAEADLVVLATPVEMIITDGPVIADAMRPGSLLTDVGSTKQRIVEALEGAQPGVGYLGSHPLAGSEQRGIAAARPGLFEGAACVVTPTRRTPARALRMITRLWRALGCRVVKMSAAEHDRQLAAVSHLPHALAYGLVHGTDPASLPIAPRSFLDATRIAESDPDLWDDIFLTNATALLEAMNRFDASWQRLRRAVQAGDRTALREFMAQAQQARKRLDAR
jgi:prephenate dehydrogenase